MGGGSVKDVESKKELDNLSTRGHQLSYTSGQLGVKLPNRWTKSFLISPPISSCPLLKAMKVSDLMLLVVHPSTSYFDGLLYVASETLVKRQKVEEDSGLASPLYIKGDLIGGSDIVLEMQKSGELKQFFVEEGITKGKTLEDRLKKLITSSPVMLFMKGTPDAPRCGFSSKVVNSLKEEGVNFGSFDILSDEEVRQGLKTFSNWPTFPQLYYKGELIGGCDVVMELKNNRELKSTLSE
ncbi:unnamed protein product [Ilex paraguariensis]|uniref:Glutaredoxin domain-containing protein n=1 Tax=Ilex paraguariensis TaxID=185542 RepID=A0ABC8UL65_9AQUA